MRSVPSPPPVRPAARGALAIGAPGALTACVLCSVPVVTECTAPQTLAVLDNDYPAEASVPLVAYRGYWQAVSFSTPVPPGSSSAPKDTVPASANTAYAVIAPGWDPASSTKPSSFVVLESRDGFSVTLGGTLRIPLDDANFAGNCAAGSFLSQSQADFVTQRVFPSVFSGLRYDAATCSTSALPGGADP